MTSRRREPPCSSVIKKAKQFQTKRSNINLIGRLIQLLRTRRSGEFAMHYSIGKLIASCLLFNRVAIHSFRQIVRILFHYWASVFFVD